MLRTRSLVKSHITGTTISKAISEGESASWEFKSGQLLGDLASSRKEARSKLFDELSADVASFANASGGIVVIGVDESSGKFKATGVTISDLMRRTLTQALRKRLSPIPEFEIVNVNVKSLTLGLIIVNQLGNGVCSVDGRIWLRTGSSKSLCSGEEISRIVRSRPVIKPPLSVDGSRQNSPYNVAELVERERRMLSDFSEILSDYKSATIRTVSPQLLHATFRFRRREHRFAVRAFGNGFGQREYNAMMRNMTSTHYKEKLDQVFGSLGLRKQCGIVCLVFGRVSDFSSKLELAGLSLVATKFGFYRASLDIRIYSRFPINPWGHLMMIGGVTDKETLHQKSSHLLEFLSGIDEAKKDKKR